MKSNPSTFSNTSYLFLAIVFSMMCCSSMSLDPTSALKSIQIHQHAIQKQLTGLGENLKQSFNEKLMILQSESQSISQAQDAKMEPQKLRDKAGQRKDPLSFVKTMLGGQFAYLTYYILSATSFFFWVTPNYHKLSRMFQHSQEQLIAPQKGKRTTKKQNF